MRGLVRLLACASLIAVTSGATASSNLGYPHSPTPRTDSWNLGLLAFTMDADWCMQYASLPDGYYGEMLNVLRATTPKEWRVGLSDRKLDEARKVHLSDMAAIAAKVGSNEAAICQAVADYGISAFGLYQME